MINPHCPMMREASLTTLSNTNIRDPSHDEYSDKSSSFSELYNMRLIGHPWYIQAKRQGCLYITVNS